MPRNILLLSFVTIISVVALDALAQHWAFTLAANEPVVVTPFFNLVKVWNPGISFGMFQQLVYGQLLLSGLALIIIALLINWLRQVQDKPTALALSLIIGGAIGNMADRIRYGAVGDYLDFHVYGYHWPAFNITDSAICIGVILLILYPARKGACAKAEGKRLGCE